MIESNRTMTFKLPQVIGGNQFILGVNEILKRCNEMLDTDIYFENVNDTENLTITLSDTNKEIVIENK